MVLPTKKRKRPLSNRTLMDFFPGTDEKRAKAKPSQQLARGDRTWSKMSSRDIIVIDSDSDDDANGKEKASNLLGSRTETSEDLTTIHSKDRDIFGAPSELLCPMTPRVEASNNTLQVHQPSLVVPRPCQPELTFGGSAPLLEQTRIGSSLRTFNRIGDDSNMTITGDQSTKTSQDDFAGRNNSFTVAEDSSVDPSTARFCIGEWGVTDDELIDPEVLDRSVDVDEGGFADEHFCPVCGTGMTGIFFELQTHVNRCLDESLQNNNLSMQGQRPAPVSIKPDLRSGDGSPSTLVEGRENDLYTVLMSSYKENENWTKADAIIDCNFGSTRENRRKVPSYKVLQGMPIAVDAFCYGTIPGVTAYFLTHAHSDHYTNLGSKWNSGPIYCSEETAHLISHMLAVDPIWIHPLPLDIPTVIPGTGGVSVTLIEANHCPGSCLFFFEGRRATDFGESAFGTLFTDSSRIFRYLHCGDFRASPRHVLHPAVNGKHIDHVYLDTTYLDPKYTFAPQPLVVSACAELACRLVGEVGNGRDHMRQNSTLHAWMKPLISSEREGQLRLQERVLVIVGTYSVGKERIVKAIAQALRVKIYCDPRKAAILQCQADKELHTLLTTDPAEAGVHILPLGKVTSDNLKLYFQRFKGTFSRIIGFRPTGWTYSPLSGSDFGNVSIQSIVAYGQSRHFSFRDIQPSPKSSYDVQIFSVPYSEHSSFFELTCFAMSCDWGRMIPTVNVSSATSMAKATNWLKRWELEKRCVKLCVIQPRTPDYW